MNTGSDVTFREFIQYLISEALASSNDEDINEHWRPIFKMCLPCTIDYNFIVKYEHLIEDAEMVLDMLKATHIEFPMTRGSRTNKKLNSYFEQLSLQEIKKLYQFYQLDFRLFGYNLENILGYDIG